MESSLGTTQPLILRLPFRLGKDCVNVMNIFYLIIFQDSLKRQNLNSSMRLVYLLSMDFILTTSISFIVCVWGGSWVCTRMCANSCSMCMYLFMNVYFFEHACNGQRRLLFYHYPPHSFEKSLSLNLDSWPASPRNLLVSVTHNARVVAVW